MDFHWNDERHIRPVWRSQSTMHSTISIPSSQKNGKLQEIPMLPELDEFLRGIPIAQREGWMVNPDPLQARIKPDAVWVQPTNDDLAELAQEYSNLSIAEACGVSEAAIRKWLAQLGIRRLEQC